ncbi:MAG: 2,3-bisphosphoglycerate-independent phosphoglycerate mutase [Bacteroidetes bacterium]|jgi:2,3-bisphosphoglycerate-independent phosphoglycerate mutase|nr:2,3-bisphosphoglycerate-independent phosphoglycerate mutase [Bacteroidota bacterium]
MDKKHVILIILDGWGIGKVPESDAIRAANTPFVDSLYNDYPNSHLITFGKQVGLPEGQMGNSEVGHLNIGAGRVVYQELARINKACNDGELAKNEVLQNALSYAKEKDKAVHLMGLVSDGGVHSHIDHLKVLCDITEDFGLEKVFIHAFMDGRDTDPKGGENYLKNVLSHIEDQNVELASVIGRYYAMDRDKRWERVKLAYDLLVNGKGEKTDDVLFTLKARYEDKETDEFLMPIVCVDENNNPKATIKADDVVLFFNFRTDRPRQLTTVLTQENMPDFGMNTLSLKYLTMTKYNEAFKNIEVLFEKEDIENTLGEVLSKNGLTQTRIAETEKYPHVTFFFNGGREQKFEGEKRILIASPKVATYDLKPEMSAYEVTDAIVEDIKTNQPNFICLNYANADMVGHTGDFKAAMKAVETVDICLKRLIETGLELNYEAIIIADHGNSDFMVNEDGTPNTAHTTNLVPCFYVSNRAGGATLKNGKLGDLSPTILGLLNIEPPKDMTGINLIER